jgi:hypothetical protein
MVDVELQTSNSKLTERKSLRSFSKDVTFPPAASVSSALGLV